MKEADRKEKMNRAKQVWEEHDGKITFTALGREIGVDSRTIKKWVNDNFVYKPNAHPGLLPPAVKGERRALGNRGGHGGPVGNHNARGHGCPKGYKNNLQTGEYETICFDTLTDEEKDLYNNTPDDPLVLLDARIKLLQIRERRMMQKIDALQQQKEIAEHDEYIEQHFVGSPKDSSDAVSTVRSSTKRVKLLIDKIVIAEEALTRVQEKLIKAIETKYRMLKDRKQEQEHEAMKSDTITFTFGRNNNG